MSQLNEKNYYPIQSLETAQPIALKMLEERKRMITIYRLLRSEARWIAIGDFLIIACINQVARQMNKVYPSIEIAKTLRQTDDGEFIGIHRDNELIAQLYE